MKQRIAPLTAVVLATVLYGCDGQDRFEDCYFNGEPVPEYEITVFDAVTGGKICWTEFRTPNFVGDKGWEYVGVCEYTFEDADESSKTNITINASVYETKTLSDIRKPNIYLCLLEGEQTVVDAYLSPM